MWEDASHRVVQIIAPWFDEVAVVTTASLFHQQNIVHVLVGLKPGLVKGLRGIQIYPDDFLNQKILLSQSIKVLILPFGSECMARALTDPRLHQLANQTIRNAGFVAVPANTTNLVVETGLLRPQTQAQFICQEGNLRPFVRKISAQLSTR